MHHDSGDLAPTKRFSFRAQNYSRFRPSYPPALIDCLRHEIGLRPDWRIADIGSGTGILSKLLLGNGNPVFAVEPNLQMRLEAERLLGEAAKFHSVDGTAEDTTLANESVDMVSVAQAFHWFDHKRAVTEFRRITSQGGYIVLVWNVRKTGGTTFTTRYNQIVAQFAAEPVRSFSDGDGVSFQWLRGLFGPRLQQCGLANHQDLDLEGLRGRMLSSSYSPLPGDDRFQPMMAALQDAFDRDERAGIVRLEYETKMYYGPLT